MTDPAIVITIDTSGATPVVKSKSNPIDGKLLSDQGPPFVNLYAAYCADYCGLTLDYATKRIYDLLGATKLEAVPWWTAMTIRGIDLWKDNSPSKVKVRLAQRHGIYLCHVYEEKNGRKVLLTPPVLGAARDRMLEVGTVHNYFRYYVNIPFNPDFLRQHTFVFDLNVTQEENITCVTLTQTKVDPEESEGIYSFKKWVLSLPSRHDGTKESPVLVSSERVQSALPDVGAAWAHMKACNVLFLAPSGSGKDVITEFFCDGLAPQLTGSVVSLNLAGLSSEECRLALFGAHGKVRGVVGGALPRAQKRGKNRQKEGKSGVVFVDEIHHQSSADARASLLRVMESREYEHPDYGNIGCKDLYFVFAASCTVNELRAIQPADFWNRMDFVIELGHPLDVEPYKRRAEVIQDYFDLFFSREIESLVERQVGNGRLGKKFAKFFGEAFREGAKPLGEASSEFSTHAAYLRPGLLSIRHLRALAHVMAANLVEFVFGRATSETDDVSHAIKQWIKKTDWRNVVFGRLGEIIASR